MEQLLLKMARQIDGLDEASLLSLWEKYASIVARFEPSKRWEEAALVLAIIQAKHWKNQLFNHNWALQAKPAAARPADFERIMDALPRTLRKESPAEGAPVKKATLLAFRPSTRSTAANDPKTPAPENETDSEDPLS